MGGVVVIVAGVIVHTFLFYTRASDSNNYVVYSVGQSLATWFGLALIPIGLAMILRSVNTGGKWVAETAGKIHFPSVDLYFKRSWLLTASVLLSVWVITATLGTFYFDLVPFNWIFHYSELQSYDWFGAGIAPWDKRTILSILTWWFFLSQFVVYFSFPYNRAEESRFPASAIMSMWFIFGFLLALMSPGVLPHD